MTYLYLSEDDVKQAIADYVRKITSPETAAKISKVSLQVDDGGEFLYPDANVPAVKVYLDKIRTMP